MNMYSIQLLATVYLSVLNTMLQTLDLLSFMAVVWLSAKGVVVSFCKWVVVVPPGDTVVVVDVP